MTGEITLNGKVLPIGGVESKIIAAKREGLKRIVIPKDNERDVKNIPETITEGLEIVFVSDFVQVAQFVFGDEHSWLET